MFGFWRIAGSPSYAPFAGAGEEIITGFGTEGVELITTTRLEIMVMRG
jgi:hypothetical protein